MLTIGKQAMGVAGALALVLAGVTAMAGCAASRREAVPDGRAAAVTGLPRGGVTQVPNNGALDTDHDGIADAIDHCPLQEGTTSNAGCPEGDSDGDGIIDRLDSCPMRAGPASNGGCPEGGLVASARPDTPTGLSDGRSGGVTAALSAPPPILIDQNVPDDRFARFTGVIEGVTFKEDSATLDPPAQPALDRAADVLVRNPQLRVLVAGYTDDVGDRDANRALSQRRAEAVRVYLIHRGVVEAQLVAAGYGAERPIADNKTEVGRRRNRRVEFQLVSKGGK